MVMGDQTLLDACHRSSRFNSVTRRKVGGAESMVRGGQSDKRDTGGKVG